ncbi:MAG: hypothetical protein QNJ38_15595 [Prochloraceae cyanobacterium]|nr:hypothetical protein [Prochloraceae cyanobacterium]
MFEVHLKKAKDINTKNRDLEIDYLTDLFEYNQLSEREYIYIIEELIKMLQDEKDEDVIESVFNLFGWAFGDGICDDLIVETCTEMLHNLDSMSLFHAIPIIGESKLENKKILLEPYLKSENPDLRKEAEEVLINR